jgi:hypothetical protein
MVLVVMTDQKVESVLAQLIGSARHSLFYEHVDVFKSGRLAEPLHGLGELCFI